MSVPLTVNKQRNLLMSVYFVTRCMQTTTSKEHTNRLRNYKIQKTFKSWVETSMPNLNKEFVLSDSVSRAAPSQRVKQKRRLDEAMADVAEFRGAQYDFQKKQKNTKN